MTSGGDDAAAPSGERVAAALKVERPAGHKARAGIRLSVPGGRRSARGASEGLAAARQESEERESGGRGRMMQLGWGTDGRGCGACSVRRRNSPVRRRVLASRVRRRQSGSPGAGGRDDQQPNRHCHSPRRHGSAGPASSAAQQQRCAPGVGLAMCSKALAWRSGRCALCCSGPGGGSPLAEGGTQTGQGQRLVGFELYS